ncbi:Peptidoglycan/LPS O-acetylase OafA/YrhL, contains acyltransferase and SGNH-hydrolase domains [Sinosporangium album]|uniref:Peptidoglycan/LPS O-acetylase OafA/YrhL, contains acyltransferase and SGNH-hydrolase domains n=1 Tax=Sinosporangium album TaxID=504805 RepID=A0A1G8I6H0_9ACTN|nr:acyltransferase [Sinosporangium album]SDI14437.1 Peptidoglycan/LPS O-acetylase OafA/YrhL, contains acyltransferase and SGNH-hydrolase domains [Sinosporangium album]
MNRSVAASDGRLAELDLLRFLAALAVMAFHYFVAFKSVWGERPASLFPEIAPLAGLGILGVELFFVISGFVILMSVWDRGIGRFAMSRVVRLYPAYWLSVLAVAALYGWTSATALDPKLTPGEYLLNLTMVQRGAGVADANGVYWSLWAELRFYVLIAVLMLIGVTLKRCMAFMGVWLAASVLAGWIGGELMDLLFMPKYAPYFIAGMALYLIHRFGSSVLLWGFVVVCWALAVLAATTRVAGRTQLVGPEAMPVQEWSVVAAVTVIFVLMALMAVGALRKLRWRGFGPLGGITYPLYLFHTPVAVLMVPSLREGMSPWAASIMVSVTAVAVSYLIYRLAEQPLQRLMRPRLRASAKFRRSGRLTPSALPDKGDKSSEKASVP